MSDVVARFEACCAQLAVDPVGATSWLMAFRREAQALAWAREVIEAAGVSATARFQAVAALRDATLNRWPTLGDEERQGVREYLLRLGTTCGDDEMSRCALGALGSVCALGIADPGWPARSVVERCRGGPALVALVTAFKKGNLSSSAAQAKARFEAEGGLAACLEAAENDPSLVAELASWDGRMPAWWLMRVADQAIAAYERDASRTWRDALVSIAGVESANFGGDLASFAEDRIARVAAALFKGGDTAAAAMATARVAALCGTLEAHMFDYLRVATRTFLDESRRRSAEATELLRRAIGESSRELALRGQSKAEAALDALRLEPASSLLDAWAVAEGRRDDVGLYAEYVAREIEARRCEAAAALAVNSDEDADLNPSDEDDAERYGLCASIGRPDAAQAASFLSSRLENVLRTRPETCWDREACFEEMRVVVEVAVELITDPPNVFSEVPSSIEVARPDRVVALVSGVVRCAEAATSPAVATAIARFFARFVYTYLETGFASGEFRNRPRVVSLVACWAARWLEQFPGEPGLARRAVEIVAALANARGGVVLTVVDEGVDAWVEAWLAAAPRLSPRVRGDLYRASTDVCLARHVVSGGALSVFERRIAEPLRSRIDFRALAGVARSAASQLAEVPADHLEDRATAARRAPSDLVVGSLISARPTIAALKCARDLAFAQIAYASPNTRATFLHLLPPLVVQVLAAQHSDDHHQDDDDDDRSALSVAIETVDLVLADGLLADEPAANARSATAALGAVLSRVDSDTLASDVDMSQRFFRAISSLAALDVEPPSRELAAHLLQALVFGAALPDELSARAALRATAAFALSDMLAAHHATLLFDAFSRGFLRPSLRSARRYFDDDLADASLACLATLAKYHPAGLANGLALAILQDEPEPATRSAHTTALANDLDNLLRHAPLSNAPNKQARRAFQATFALFLAASRAYLAKDNFHLS